MTTKIYDIAIIGAGASGLAAAITAARAGAHPILLEHMELPAKKILATGNGKCNYTNADQGLQNYYCDEPGFVQTVLTQFSYADTLRFFEELGIRPRQQNGSCIYPESGQASSVRSALLAEAQRLHIPMLLSAEIRSIHKIGHRQKPAHMPKAARFTYQFQIHIQIGSKEQDIYSRICILAAGGKAAKKTGSDGSGYIFAKQLGHTISDPLPALTALQADYSRCRLPAGVRIYCTAVLMINGKRAAKEQGELQITDYGISGIVIFQFCRLAARALAKGRQAVVLLDFKPDITFDELAAYLKTRMHSIYHRHKSLNECLIGFLPDKLIPAILQRAGLLEKQKSALCKEEEIKRLAQALKKYKVLIKGTKDFDSAQVTTGGIPISEINPRTMESKVTSGLYFSGEIVDVDGKCGGYNLQWAWASGYAAGKNSAAAVGYSSLAADT